MKTQPGRLKLWLGKALVACALFGAAVAVGHAQQQVTVTPKDTGKALVNPGMGWTLMFYSNMPQNYGSKLLPSDTVEEWPGLAVVYLRVPWAYIEPQEGHFNWALLDTPAQRWIAKGKRVALRITCSENWLRFATPEWVKNAGAKGVFYEFGKGPKPNGDLWDPDFADPVFLDKLDHLLAAMAARYDANPDVAFIDIGSFGMWGEGHTMASSQIPQERTNQIMRQHIDLYLKHFKHTQLAVLDDATGPESKGAHQPITDYALSKGVTLRDDSICVQPPPRSWFHAEMAQLFWPTLPVIVEHEHYGPSKERGAWKEGSLLLKAVEEYHPSYLTIHWWPHEMLAETSQTVSQVNQRLGYRLQLRQMSWPSRVHIDTPFSVESRWANAGVAPCYQGAFMALTLKDAQGGIVAVLADEGTNMRDLKVGPISQAPEKNSKSEFCVGHVAPTTRPGTYEVYVSVGRRDGTPQIALPLENDDGQKRYRLGTITLDAQ